MVRSPYSIYIHVPFCTRKCDYCHFFVIPYQRRYVDTYLTALKREIERNLPLLSKEGVVSIYFGGGTPSLLLPEEIAQILSWLPPAEEVTLEANPENTTHLAQWKQLGINRVSFGVQSFEDTLLNELTRLAGSHKAIEAVLAAKQSGIDNISIDLMYDIPGQTLANWRRTLAQAVSLPITHLSLYNLTFEPHTAFYLRKEALLKRVPQEEISLQMLQEAVNTLEEHGLKRYEISAFAKEGYLSQHNYGYWTGRPFLGFGPSAYSYWEGKRFRNSASLSQWAKKLEEGQSPCDFEECLSPLAQKREMLAVNLRLLEGVPFQEPLDPTLKKLLQDDFLRYEKQRLYLTEKGLLFYDTVASEIIEE